MLENTIFRDKNSLRCKLRQCLADFLNLDGGDARQREEYELRAQLQARIDPEDTVLAFVPRPDEPDIWPVLQQVAAHGRLAFARVAGTGLQFVPYPETELVLLGPFWQQNPKFQITEPATFPNLPANLSPSPALLPKEMAESPRIILLCPGLGFAAHNCHQYRRIGRGAGFYDRTITGLRQRPQLETWGLGFSVQLCQEVAFDPSCDQILDRLLLGGRFFT